MVKSLLRRPFDLVCFIYFASHIPITLIVDSQAVLPASWYPQFAKDLLAFHIKTNGDYLMASPPTWFLPMVYSELTFQLAFFPFAAYAFLKGVNSIRWPVVVYSVHVVTTLIVILGDILLSGQAGEHKWPLFFIYFPYLAMPLAMAIRMYLTELPFGAEAPKRKSS